MALANATLITVTGTYTRLDGRAAKGQVFFSSDQVLVDSTSGEIVPPVDFVATLDANGAISIDLPATDDEDYEPQGWTYTVTEDTDGGDRPPFGLSVPADGGTIDLADVAPPGPTESLSSDEYTLLSTFTSHRSAWGGDPPAGSADDLLGLDANNVPKVISGDAYGPTIERVFMDRDYGVHPDEAASTNAQGINAAISDAQGNVTTQTERKVELWFHPGEHSVNAELGYEASSSDELSLALKGQGRKGTIITQTDDTLRLFRFVNTVPNLRNLLMDDLWLQGGTKALYLERTAYSLLRNVVFNKQVAGSHAAFHAGPGSHDVVSLGCHWVHTDARDAIENESTRHFISASTIGEDCGGIRNTGVLYVGGDTHSTGTAKLPSGDSGPGGLGTYAYYSTGYLSLGEHLTRIGTADQVLLTDMGTDPAFNLLGMDVAGAFRLDDATTRFWTNISMASAAASARLASEVSFRGTTGPKELLGENSTSGAWVHDSVLEPRVRHASGVTATLHDGVFDRSRNNRVAGIVRAV